MKWENRLPDLLILYMKQFQLQLLMEVMESGHLPLQRPIYQVKVSKYNSYSIRLTISIIKRKMWLLPQQDAQWASQTGSLATAKSSQTVIIEISFYMFRMIAEI